MNSKGRDLIGDFSRHLSLPVIKGARHPDLNTITSETLSDLLEGKYNDEVKKFRIIDCRYPYEYNGGHVKFAENWNKPNIVIEELRKKKAQQTSSDKPENNNEILIFHCEFSANRGPKYLRLLREEDRDMNEYPTLCFPEVYLLKGGYKEFFASYPDLCEPKSYVKMIDPNYADDLKSHKAQCKLWFVDNTIRGKGPIARISQTIDER